MPIFRFALTFATVLLISIIAGAHATAAANDLEFAESTALKSILCEDMSSASAQRVSATLLECKSYYVTHPDVKPASCLVKSVSGHTVSLTLTGCKTSRLASPTSGVFVSGELVTGSVKAAFIKNATGLHVHTTGSGLKIGTDTLAVDDTTTYHVVGSIETISDSHSSSGADSLGHSVSNTGSFTSVSDTSALCLTVNGNWKLESDGLKSSVAATNLKHCMARGIWSCPSGTITMTDISANKSTATYYNGTNTATLRLPNGGSELIPLPCGP